MESSGVARTRRSARTTRQRLRADTIETTVIVALAALVLLKGAPALAGVAQGIAGMMMALTRL